jgi:hypothetical protein
MEEIQLKRTSHVDHYGLVRSITDGAENLKLHDVLYEVIDDRKHSNSNKVLIDFNYITRSVTFGYENQATLKDISNTKSWLNSNSDQNTGTNIASQGAGLKYVEYGKLKGKWKHATFHDNNNTCYYTSMDTKKIKDIFDNLNKNEQQKSSRMKTAMDQHSRDIYEEPIEEMSQSIYNIFLNKNEDDSYPFIPKTVFRGSRITEFYEDSKIEDESYYENIHKILNIKYYDEIKNGNIELWIRWPKSGEFQKCEAKKDCDIIGTTQKEKEHVSKIYICPKEYLQSIVEIQGKYYKFRKNGKTKKGKNILIEEYKDFKPPENPDIIISQFQNKHFIREGRKKPEFPIEKESLPYGCSIEQDFTGSYLRTGGTFVSSFSMKDANTTKRNLPGNSAYRCIIELKSTKARKFVVMNGLKSNFDLTNKNAFLKEIYDQCVKLYKKYINLMESEGKVPSNPNNYVLTKSSPKRTENTKKNVPGYFYIKQFTEDLFKIGYATSKNRVHETRGKEELGGFYNDSEQYTILPIPMITFTGEKIPKIEVFEQVIKAMILGDENCTTFDCQEGDQIREYFRSNSFPDVYINILKKLEEHIKEK